MEQQQKPFFDKQITLLIKGVALILMFLHHFFTMPGLWMEYVSYPFLEKAAAYLYQPSKICVPIFCFLTGYSYYFNRKKDLSYSLRKITDLFVNYVVVFVVFALMARIFIGYRYNVSNFLLEIFAIKRYTMVFCWYVYFYYIVMLLLPLISKYLFSDSILIDSLKILFCVPLIISFLNYAALLFFNEDSFVVEVICNLVFLPLVLIGYLFAKFRIFEKLDDYVNDKIHVKSINIVVFVGFAVISPFGRLILPGIEMPIGIINKTLSISLDAVYVPMMIYSIIKSKDLVGENLLSKTLAIIGKYSLLMWFSHCVFFNNLSSIFRQILYYPRNPLLVTFWSIFLCLTFSFVIDKIIRPILYLKNKFVFKKI